jgi:tagatose 1,6-diphosphate aldolase GatY/KbaY
VAIVVFTELLESARARTAAVGAFTCYDLVTGAAVLAAAEARAAGVVLMVSASAARAPSGRGLLRGLRALGEQAGCPACVQLDHCNDLALMELALDAGAGALMADGSRLPDERNAELVTRAVELARGFGAGVEAELGHVGGDEEVAGAGNQGVLTDPEFAQRFLARTGAHCLAVSIGNAHGRYRHPPSLDFPRLRSIRRRVQAPLALHGGSGLSDKLVRRAIVDGICKVNINQELRTRWFQSVRTLVGELAPRAELLELQRRVTGDLQEVVTTKLDGLEPVANTIRSKA